MALTISNIRDGNAGSEKRVDCVIGFSTYNNTGNNNTTGELLLPARVGMTGFSRVVVNSESGYQIQVLYSQSGAEVPYPTPVRFKVFQSVGGAGGVTGPTSGGTPSGTVAAPVFAGNALAGHSHNFAGDALGTHTHGFAGNALAGHLHTFSGNALATHTHNFAGNAMGNHTHTFGGNIMGTHGHIMISDGDANLTVTANAIDFSGLTDKPFLFRYIYAVAGGITGPITLIPIGRALASGQCRYNDGTFILEFFAGDAITTADIGWQKNYVQIESAGTPAGTISSDSAGTPTGTNSSTSGGTPAGTLDSVSAGTPAGTNALVSAGTPSGTNSSTSGGTPAGTNSAPAFAGNLLAAHTHAFAGGGGGAEEVPNGTDLSAFLGQVQITCYGV